MASSAGGEFIAMVKRKVRQTEENDRKRSIVAIQAIKKNEQKKQDDLKRVFTEADVSKTGKLSLKEWTGLLEKNGHNLQREEVKKLFEEKDKDLDGYMSFEEFSGQETKMELAFKAMDIDGNGFISKDEFQRACKKLSPEQVEAVFKKFDVNKDHLLNYREFCKMVNTRREKKAKAAAAAAEKSKKVS